MQIIQSFITVFIVLGCIIPKKQKSHTNIPDYQLSKVLKLDASLQEISGLDFSNGNIYTHNDEEGIIYMLHPQNGSIQQKIKFADAGDYEGIEIINNKAIITNSEGSLFIYDSKTKQTDNFTNNLQLKNNIEGLCKTADNNLLIAFKGKMLKGSNAKGIYRYNLNEKILLEHPFLKIKLNKLKRHLDIDVTKKKNRKLLNRIDKFAPSGIAIHPKTEDYYIISARGNVLVIYNKDKELKNVIFLDEKILPQPEGICFDPKGKLYISSETKENYGILATYKYIN